MIAAVGSTHSIAATLLYNQNPKKGGEIVLSSGIDPHMPVRIQAKYLEAISNQRFKVKGHTIVISHGKKDSKEITPEQEKLVLKKFLENLEARGVKLDSAPWIIARHNNTDCIHYHMIIMNTCYDGSRFDNAFIGVRACRAAADISLMFELEMTKKGAAAVKKSCFQVDKNGNVEIAEHISNKIGKAKTKRVNRREAIAKAKERKEKYVSVKAVIMEKCSPANQSNALAKAESIFESKENKHLFNDLNTDELYKLCTSATAHVKGYYFVRNVNQQYNLRRENGYVDYENMPKAAASKAFEERKQEFLFIIRGHNKEKYEEAYRRYCERNKREWQMANEREKTIHGLINTLIYHPELFVLELLLSVAKLTVHELLNDIGNTLDDISLEMNRSNNRGMHFHM